jgi:hypothetical protein
MGDIYGHSAGCVELSLNFFLNYVCNYLCYSSKVNRRVVNNRRNDACMKSQELNTDRDKIKS